MKALTKKQIMIMVNDCKNETITKEEMDEMFEQLGDEYFTESSYAPFVLTTENPAWHYVRMIEPDLPHEGDVMK